MQGELDSVDDLGRRRDNPDQGHLCHDTRGHAKESEGKGWRGNRNAGREVAR